jgi:hypothetical protein
MRKILFLLLFPTILSAQGILFTAGVPHTGNTPAYTPSKTGSRLCFDTLNDQLYFWNSNSWNAFVGGGGGDGIYGRSDTVVANLLVTIPAGNFTTFKAIESNLTAVTNFGIGEADANFPTFVAPDLGSRVGVGNFLYNSNGGSHCFNMRIIDNGVNNIPYNFMQSGSSNEYSDFRQKDSITIISHTDPANSIIGTVRLSIGQVGTPALLDEGIMIESTGTTQIGPTTYRRFGGMLYKHDYFAQNKEAFFGNFLDDRSIPDIGAVKRITTIEKGYVSGITGTSINMNTAGVVKDASGTNMFIRGYAGTTTMQFDVYKNGILLAEGASNDYTIATVTSPTTSPTITLAVAAITTDRFIIKKTGVK